MQSSKRHKTSKTSRAKRGKKEAEAEEEEEEEENGGEGVAQPPLSEEEKLMKQQLSICPDLTGGALKPYQVAGVKWLASLWCNGINGILADQMGLGKTVQTLGLLSHLRGRKVFGPFLIVAPLSTLPNWVNEITRWGEEVGTIREECMSNREDYGEGYVRKEERMKG